MEDRFRQWHLVQISDGFDERARSFLERYGIVLYRPLLRVLKPAPAKKLSRAQRQRSLRPMREKIEPMFPGYVFVSFEAAGELWREMFKMVHVRGLACASGRPVQVPWSMIEKLQQQEVDGVIPGKLKASEIFSVGELVRITAGPFASFGGTVGRPLTVDMKNPEVLTLDQLDESMRVQILVEFFGRQTPLQISALDLEKA